ncbi:hypothetical protein E4T80_09765 [Muribacter muris]|uniref:Uncharacterized protein n=1 Tax=Muribacter muris TaxID=67855 RepID=A0A4Y9JVN5_9PAST|nr:phage regulatory CII family protein [Muribacter muris]MBF0785744.1 hypothetical protein [Muribacter muris]MBF0828284.1 hypothetical protein [Muribacter muris]TFV08567.1 hypothetical protein E4T80_09765 [Muribacter muris]
MNELQSDHSFAPIQQTLQLRCKTARGGISSLALGLGKCEKKLANELNINVEQNKLGFMDAVQLIVLTESRNVVEMMAREVGCTLLPMPTCQHNSVDQLREVLNLSSQAGQLCGKYSRSISPDSELGENLSRKEIHELLDILNRLQDSVQCLKWELGQ